jgi:hypothetical protein
MTGGASDGRAHCGRPSEIVIATGVLVLAIVVFWQTMTIPVSPIYARSARPSFR